MGRKLTVAALAIPLWWSLACGQDVFVEYDATLLIPIDMQLEFSRDNPVELLVVVDHEGFEASSYGLYCGDDGTDVVERSITLGKGIRNCPEEAQMDVMLVPQISDFLDCDTRWFGENEDKFAVDPSGLPGATVQIFADFDTSDCKHRDFTDSFEIELSML